MIHCWRTERMNDVGGDQAVVAAVETETTAAFVDVAE